MGNMRNIYKKNKKVSIIILLAIFMSAVFALNGTKTNAGMADINEKRTWNSKTYSTEKENKFTTEFHSKWIHYLGENSWNDIDTNFYPAENGFEMTNAPFEWKSAEVMDKRFRGARNRFQKVLYLGQQHRFS